MAGLDFYPKHNMVAYLEKNDVNADFYQIMDFLACISIHFALTVSPIVSTSFVEQFWTTAKSRTVNNISYIDAIVAGKPVTISEASIRRNVTPLFDSMLVQPTKDAGEVSKRPSESHPMPSPTHPSKDQHEPRPDPSLIPSTSTPILDSNPEGSGGNHEGQSSSDRYLSGNKDGLTLQSIYDLYVSLCQQVTTQVAKIKALKAQIKQLKKKAKPVIHHHKAWCRVMRLKKSKKRRSVSKQRRKAVKSSEAAPSGSDENRGSPYSTAQQQSANKPVEGTDKPDEGTDKTSEGTDKTKVSTDGLVEGTVKDIDQTPGETLIRMSQNKIKLKEKEKGVELKDVEDIERPRPTSTRSVLTLKPLPKIDPKAKGKGMIKEEDESDTESEDITKAEKKFKMLANDEELAKKVRLNTDKILAEKLQEEEREMFTIKQRAKLLHDTIHVRGKKHSDLKTKKFEEIQALYEKIKRSDESFIVIGSAKDERLIKQMNDQVVDPSNKKVKKDNSIKEESKEKEENEELRLCLTIATDEDKEVDYEVLDKKYPIIEWKSEFIGIKPQYDETKELEEINLNVVTRSNRQKRFFSTLMTVLSRFDRDDLCFVHQLLMDKYQDEVPEGFDRVLWGDLMIMFNPSDEGEFWNSQEDWKVVSWKLHGSSRVHTLMTEDGLVIHMLIEKKYPLRKKVLLQMLELKLESKEDSNMALELIRYVTKQIKELEAKKSNGDKEDP
ncbi:hypothetical protein Tco_0551229 [Tanacetum coccineum]